MHMTAEQMRRRCPCGAHRAIDCGSLFVCKKPRPTTPVSLPLHAEPATENER